MIFVENMIVIFTAGKYAGKKGVIVKVIDEGNVLVAGVNRIPKKSEDFMSKAEKRRNDKFLVMIKKANIRHLLATRYKADIGINNINVDGYEKTGSRNSIKKEIVDIFEKARKDNRAKFLFTELVVSK